MVEISPKVTVSMRLYYNTTYVIVYKCTDLYILRDTINWATKAVTQDANTNLHPEDIFIFVVTK